MIQSCGSYNSEDDYYSFSVAKGDLVISMEGLTFHEVESLADLFLCLLYREGEPYTWHSEFEPNDVY